MCQAQPWQRNTFPGKGHYENGYLPGRGWDHSEANQDIEVSPLNPSLRAHIDNEWSAVISRDGQYFEPIQMPYIGGGQSKIEDLEFSGYNESTLYVVLAHEYWRSLSNDLSQAGIWRSDDTGETWEHIYSLPDGAYERYGNYPEGTHLLEDPVHERGHHLYFGTTSHGIVRSTDGGDSWENIAPVLDNRCIKMIAAGREGDETWIYAIAEKNMPLHEQGKTVPLDAWGPTDYTESWDFDHTLSGTNGNGLDGTVAYWTESCAEGSHAAFLDGAGSGLAIQHMHYSGSYSNLTVSAWVKTSKGDGQVIASFDRDAYWELGINGTGADTGRVSWTINNSEGKQFTRVSTSRVDDGDWHHVAGVWVGGEIRVFVDGEQEAYAMSTTPAFGTGVTRYGYLGAGSRSEALGDGLIDPGGIFEGCLDEVRIYNNRGLSLTQYQGVYLENNHKYQVPQGSLWRVKIGSDGSITEVVRLHPGLDDFVYVTPNPLDPSSGWVIRKALPKAWPYGGREVYRFSGYGEDLHLTDIQEGNSDGIYSMHIHPSDTSRLFLRCGGDLSSALRYSLDAGLSWLGTDRPLENGTIPSLQPWSPAQFKNYGSGLPADAGGQPRGTDITLVPGNPGEVLYISAANGLYRSLDHGATFSAYGGGGSNKDLGQIAVAPGNPDHWATCSFEFGFLTTGNGGRYWEGEGHSNNGLLEELTLMSENEGNNWTFSRTGVGIAYHPYDSHQLVATYTKKGFILRSGDAGKTWSFTGVSTGEASSVFWCRADTRRIYAGNKRSSDGGASWTDIQKHVVAVSETNADLVVGLNQIERDITAHSLGMYLSLDGGNTWVSLPTPPKEMVPGTSSRWNILATSRIFSLMAMDLIDIDPSPGHDPAVDPDNRVRVLMAGRSGIYDYTASEADGSGFAANWQVRNTGIEPNRHFSIHEPVPWMGFVIFDPRPGFGHVVYAAKTNDWQTLDDWCGEGNKNHGYPGGDNLEPFYMSLDGGITWDKLHGEGYPGAPASAMVHSLEVDAYGRFYAATCEGIYHVAVDGIASAPPAERFRVQFAIEDEETGDPVQGCILHLDSVRVATNEEGRVGVDGMKAGVYTLQINAAYYESKEISGIEISSDTSLAYTLKNTAHEVSVRVLDRSTGEPVSRAQVTCDGVLKITSIPGEVRYDKITSGYRLLTIAHADYFTWSDTILLTRDTTLTIEITATRASLGFDVHDSLGPLAGVPVTVDGTTLSTGASGLVVFAGLNARSACAYTIEHPGYIAVRDTVFLEIDTVVNILLEPDHGTGIQDRTAPCRIYPNPADDKLYLNIPFHGALLRLVDPGGRLIMERVTARNFEEMDISRVASGSYFLHVCSEEGNLVVKLIIL